MSNLEASFLEAIARQPHDWLPRLIFADWLEEQGDPRGELIRIQEQLRKLEVPDRPQLEQQMHQLIARGVQPLTITRTNSIGMKLVLIFPGEFLMGSPPEELDRKDTEEQLRVTLTRGLWLGQFPVTQEEYQQVTGENPSHFDQANVHIPTERFPVERVSWEDARKFCERLTEIEREQGLLKGWGYTLPTEPWWEYACRSGTTTATAFGDSLSSLQANFDGNFPYHGAEKGPNLDRPTEVGRYPPNAWNLYDMHGNVDEWCMELAGPEFPPYQADQHLLRMYRGGNWNYDGEYSRSASRYCDADHTREFTLGFRVALDPTL